MIFQRTQSRDLAAPEIKSIPVQPTSQKVLFGGKTSFFLTDIETSRAQFAKWH